MPANDHRTKVYAVQQCRITPITADSAGNTITYGASVPVPGCKALKTNGTINNVELWGDNQLLDEDSMLKSIDIELDYAKLSLDLITVMLGGTVTDAGTAPNQTSTYNGSFTPTFGYFKIEARPAGVDIIGGDLHYVYAKCKLVDFPQLGLMEEGYQVQNLKCKALPPLGTNIPWSIVLNQTAVAIT